MNKEKIYWAKSIILSYRYLERMCGALDKQIKQIASNSFYQTSFFEKVNSVHNVSREIIDLSQRKLDYINIKVLVEKILSSINEKLSKVLIFKYIQCLKNEQITSVLKISERTMFRRINKAFIDVAIKMEEFVFNKEKMEIKFICDSFIGCIFKKLQTKENNNKAPIFAENCNNGVYEKQYKYDTYLGAKNIKMA